MLSVKQRPHAAVFLVRAWWENGQFRARISYSHNVEAARAEEAQVTTADPDEVRQYFARWLTEARRRRGRHDQGPGGRRGTS
jgi:hypothetical protein